MKGCLFLVSLWLPVWGWAVYAPIPESQQGQLLSISLEGFFGYDDNLFGAPQNEVDSSLFRVTPKIASNYALGDQGFLTASYQLDAEYYDERPTEDKLYNHRFEGVFSYAFSERLTLKISEEFNVIDNPESSLTLGLTDLQTNQSYWDNRISVESVVGLTEKLGAIVSLDFYGINYDEANLAQLLDLRRGEMSISGRYALLPKWTLVGETRFQEVTYDVNNTLKGSETLYLISGFDYSASEQVVIQARLGVENRDRNSGDSKSNFYGNLAFVYSFEENSAIAFAVTRRFREASNTLTFSDSEVTSFLVSFEHDLTGGDRFYLGGMLLAESVQLNVRPGLASGDVNDSVIRFGFSLTYKIKENLVLSGTFDRDHIRSDEFFREQVRNRFGLSLQYQFGGIQ